MEWTFTEETWHMMHQLQAIRLGESIQGEDRKIYMSKLMEVPMSILKYKVERMLGRVSALPVYDQLKMFTYDGHDTQAIILLSWLNASNLEYPQPTVYATQISFELIYSDACLQEEEANEECFAIQVLYNGAPLEFAGVCQ